MLHSPSKSLRRFFRLVTILLALSALDSPLAASAKVPAARQHYKLPTMDLAHKCQKGDGASGAKAARIAKALATNLTTRHPSLRSQQQLCSYTTQSLASQTEGWLNRWGTARVSLNNSDNKFKRFDGSIALLLPIDSLTRDPATFTQWLIEQERSETTLSVGIGQRYELDKWLVGGNLFSDNNLTRSHSRLGVGLEAWSNFLRLSANGYIPLTKWKTSKKLNWEREKPSGGFDIRLQGYLPIYQQIGGKLLFEQYYGDEVALFGVDKLQRNPIAAGVELSYTPFPLLTLAVGYHLGNQKQDSTRCSLQLQYVLNTPWRHQVDSTRVANLRSLSFSQFDFVDRNNRMVMQRESDRILLKGEPNKSGPADTDLNLEYTFKAQLGLKDILILDDEISKNEGTAELLPFEDKKGQKDGMVLDSRNKCNTHPGVSLQRS